MTTTQFGFVLLILMPFWSVLNVDIHSYTKVLSFYAIVYFRIEVIQTENCYVLLYLTLVFISVFFSEKWTNCWIQPCHCIYIFVWKLYSSIAKESLCKNCICIKYTLLVYGKATMPNTVINQSTRCRQHACFCIVVLLCELS